MIVRVLSRIRGVAIGPALAVAVVEVLDVKNEEAPAVLGTIENGGGVGKQPARMVDQAALSAAMTPSSTPSRYAVSVASGVRSSCARSESIRVRAASVSASRWAMWEKA